MTDELGGRTILLVDDEVLFGLVIQRSLERFGATPIIACSLADARKALGVFTFDAAIIDLLLLNGNGLAFIEELGETHPTLPCILCTGVDTDSMGAPRPGVCYMQKPVMPDELVAKLLEVIRNAVTLPSPPPEPSTPANDREDSTVPGGVFYPPSEFDPEELEPTKVVNIGSSRPPPPPEDK